jgi:hypothetical protein
MRRHQHHDSNSMVSTLEQDSAAHVARVEEAERRMRTIAARRHTPAEARDAARELSLTLGTATAAVVRALRVVAPAPTPPRRWQRHANHPVTAAMQRSTAALGRLTGIGVWLRRTTLDDLGVHLPTTVRIGSRAASGPHIAGIDYEPADPAAATLHQPLIGVDLPAVVDGAGAPPPSPRPTPAGNSTPVPTATPRAA